MFDLLEIGSLYNSDYIGKVKDSLVWTDTQRNPNAIAQITFDFKGGEISYIKSDLLKKMREAYHPSVPVGAAAFLPQEDVRRCRGSDGRCKKEDVRGSDSVVGSGLFLLGVRLRRNGEATQISWITQIIKPDIRKNGIFATETASSELVVSIP